MKDHVSSSANTFEQALDLIRHAGLPAPDGTPGTQGWLSQLVGRLVDLSSRDPLTDLPNRRTFDSVLAREVDRVARSGEQALLLMIDIDHFKRVNDNFGHRAGDLVLKAVARELVKAIRPMDLAARFGGEEFAIILPNCSAAFGQQVAERIRRRVEAVRVPHLPTQDLQVTLSIGGAYAPQWVRSMPALWTERADQLLYQAKNSGRNKVCLESGLLLDVTVDERRLLFTSPESSESP